jgi:hypothetical protein
MTHAHLSSWVFALILFFIAVALHKSGKQTGAKVVHMILRVFYLLILLTGIMLLFSLTKISGLYMLKSAVGLWVIAVFEMILVKSAKQGKTSGLWIQFLIALLLVIYLGFKLPLGFYFF